MDKLPKKNLDIEQIIDKISTLPIDDKDKAAILEQMKSNMMNPSKGENKSLDAIQDKYSSINMPRSEDDHNFNLKPISNNQSQNNQSQNNQGYNNQDNHNKYKFMDQSQPMTVAHFEILKSKLDSVQYELIDLLRHVKDYTQRYMNAVRQQDLEKITEYINGLFEVDKTLKETQELADEDIDEEAKEEEPEDRKSVISRATSGIKNLFGSIGDNVAGITNLVSNTTKIANDYLVKKVIPTSNASNVNVTKTGNTNTVVKNKNIVSIEDYISDMNKMETMNNSLNQSRINTSIPNSNIITTSSNNINSLGSIKPTTNQNTVTTPVTTPATTPASEPEDESEKLEGALKKLNDEMNKDIDKTVNNTTQSGGKRTHKNSSNKISKKENNLTNKIKLLKLKLTKNKLQKQLSESKNNRITNNMTKKIKKK